MPVVISYTINEAINCEMSYPKPFIIANERMNKDGRIARSYSTFSSFSSFLRNRDKYPNCHELLVRHKNFGVIEKEPGRLVFDFDIKNKYKLPKTFKKDVEVVIEAVCNKYYKIDDDELEFVWSSCKNDTKTSKHLTVKNIYFEDWLLECPVFYGFFSKRWDSQYDWIESDKLIDLQIVKKRTSLRMVGSRKIGGHQLRFDDKSHILQDSLIRIYDSPAPPEFIELRRKYLNKLKPIERIVIKNVSSRESVDAEYSKEVNEKAFEICNKKMPGVFSLGKISGNIITLMRNKSSKCYLSGNVHENENAYLIIKQNLINNSYSISFGCYRKCSESSIKWLSSFVI